MTADAPARPDRRRRIRWAAVREGAARPPRRRHDRRPRDYHLFTPLLYQVASCLLNPSEVAAPIRKVFRGAPNVRYRQDEVVALDHDARSRHARERRGPRVRRVRDRHRQRDELLRQRVRRGSTRSGSRTSSEALQLRNHVLTCFEQRHDDRRRSRAATAPHVLRRRRRARPAWSTPARSPSSCDSSCRSEYPELDVDAACASCCSRAATACSPPFKPRLSRVHGPSARAARRRAPHRHAGDVGRRRRRRAPRRHRAPDRDDGVDRRRAAARRAALPTSDDAGAVRPHRGRRPLPRRRARPARTRSATSPPVPTRTARCCRCSRRRRCRPAASSPPRSSARRGRAVPLPRQGDAGHDRSPGRGRTGRARSPSPASSAGSRGSSCTSTTSSGSRTASASSCAGPGTTCASIARCASSSAPTNRAPGRPAVNRRSGGHPW